MDNQNEPITADTLYQYTMTKAFSLNANAGMEIQFGYTGSNKYIGISWVNQLLAMFEAEELEDEGNTITYKNIYTLKIKIPQFISREDLSRYLSVVDEVGKVIFGKSIQLNLA